MSNVAGIAIPLITGIGGSLIGAGFSRVTSRNDERRQQYAAGLSAIDKLTSSATDPSAAAEAEWRVVEIGNCLELDSVPVSNAFKSLHRETLASSTSTLARLVEPVPLDLTGAGWDGTPRP